MKYNVHRRRTSSRLPSAKFCGCCVCKTMSEVSLTSSYWWKLRDRSSVPQCSKGSFEAIICFFYWCFYRSTPVLPSARICPYFYGNSTCNPQYGNAVVDSANWKKSKPISKSFNLKQISVSNWLRTMPGESIGRLTCCWSTLTLDTSWNSTIPSYPAGNMHFEFFELYLSIINHVLLVPSSVYRLIIIIFFFFFIMYCIARNFRQEFHFVAFVKAIFD